MDFSLKRYKSHQIQAILMDPPWKLRVTQGCENGTFEPSDIKNLRLKEVIENGFIFMWIEKEIIAKVNCDSPKKKKT